ncbi:MAG: type II secretion system F family protein [Parasporobacterium sp.]|nr:type II secretion system F family protein [Parasporobacterium sp.]
MLSFKYQAITKNGQKISGILEANNEMEAATKIRESCDVILKLQPTEVGEDGEEKKNLLAMDIGNKLDLKAFTVVCNQFAIIMKSGLPVARSVQLIADKTPDKSLKRLLNRVATDVESGKTLADSFEEHGKKKLPQTFIETIRAGEESGNLANAFASMASHFDKQIKTKAKIRSAVSYPIFVLVIAVAVVIVLMVAVVPTFSAIFDQAGAEIPGVTQFLIDLSSFVQNNIVIILIVLAVIIVGYNIYSHSEKGSMTVAKLKLKMPVLGNLNELKSAAELSNTMAIMMGSGIPMNRSISITSKVLTNKYVSERISEVTEKIEQGHDLAKSLEETEVMPAILIDMVTVGEETGELEQTLSTIAGYYDEEYNMAVDKTVSKLSPILLMVTAGIAGFIVIAMYVAMFEMYNTM